MRPANERRRYTVTPSLIGWAHTEYNRPPEMFRVYESRSVTWKSIYKQQDRHEIPRKIILTASFCVEDHLVTIPWLYWPSLVKCVKLGFVDKFLFPVSMLMFHNKRDLSCQIWPPWGILGHLHSVAARATLGIWVWPYMSWQAQIAGFTHACTLMMKLI